MIILLLSIVSCNNENEVDVKENPSQKSRDFEKKEVKSAAWRNPFQTPMGVDISRYIRAYFLVGEFDKILNFIIIPDCYSKEELLYLMRKSSWGYEIRANNLKWNSDSTFILNVKTTIAQTTGSEQYIGKIVNDTAKLYIFPERENLFAFYNEADLRNSCSLKQAMDNIQFEFNKSKILPSSYKSLELIESYLKKENSTNAHFVGHTSDEGTSEYNLKLSDQRALAIVDYLIKKGINRDRLSYEGKGKEEPIVPNSNERNKELNRRVEIKLSKNF